MGSARHLCLQRGGGLSQGLGAQVLTAHFHHSWAHSGREARKKPGWYCSYWRDQMNHEEGIVVFIYILTHPKYIECVF